MVIFGEETHPALRKIWNFKKWRIFGTQRAVFGPKNGISPKLLKLPQNNFITSLQTKNGDIWWINTPCTEKNVKFQELAYFWYTARRFWSQKWDFAKIVKTSTKQLYNKPTNQKWRYLVNKHTLHWEKCEISRNGIFLVYSAPFLAPKMGFRQNRQNFHKISL